MVKRMMAAPTAVIGVTTPWHAQIITTLITSVTTMLALVEKASNLILKSIPWVGTMRRKERGNGRGFATKIHFCLFLRAGSKAKTSTEVDSRAKPSKAVGRREARQTDAKRPALRESALI